MALRRRQSQEAEEVRDLYSLNIITFVESRRMIRKGQLARIGEGADGRIT